MKTGIIFDMDGTLWDSSQEVADSWSEVLARHPEAGRTVSRNDVRSLMGMTMTQIARVLFPQLPRERQISLLKECTDCENEYLRAHGGQLYPHLEQTLRALAGVYPLYIVSNCQSGYIEAFLAHYHFETYFQDFLCFGDDGLPKRDNIRLIAGRNALERYYYIGDIQSDCDAAIAAGARFIHASYGFGTIAQPVPVIRSLSELPELLEGLTQNP